MGIYLSGEINDKTNITKVNYSRVCKCATVSMLQITRVDG